MIWCYATVPYFLLWLFTPVDSAFWTGFFRITGVAALLAWIVVQAEPQIRFVKKQFGDNYPRKKWRLPLGVGSACLLAFCILLIAIADGDEQSGLSVFGESGDIQMVKNGYLFDYPGTPIGKAIDHFLANPKWETGTTAAGQHFVNVRGGMTYQGKPVSATIQFLVNREARTFEFHAFELNEIPQNEVMKQALMRRVFEEYRR
jgi:hypothetical protein